MRGLALPACRRRPDRRENVVRHLPVTAIDPIVGKPQHTKTLARQPLVPLRVMIRIVEGTIRLDDQPVFQASEVDHIASKRDLATELQSFQTTVSQQLPKASFRFGAPPPESPGLADSRLPFPPGIQRFAPSSDRLRRPPSPARGEGIVLCLFLSWRKLHPATSAARLRDFFGPRPLTARTS